MEGMNREQAKGTLRLVDRYQKGLIDDDEMRQGLAELVGSDRAKEIIDAAGMPRRNDLNDRVDPRKLSTVYLDPSDTGADLDISDMVVVCEICREPLKLFTNATERTYIHGRAFVRQDHDAIPVEIPRAAVEKTYCDFCGQNTRLEWKYVADRLNTMVGRHRSDFGTVWGACKECSACVNDGDLQALLKRVTRVAPHMARGMDEAGVIRMRRELIDMWSAVLPTIHTVSYVGPQREPARIDARMFPKLQAGLARFWTNIEQFNSNQNNGAGIDSVYTLPGYHCGKPDSFSVQIHPDQTPPADAWHRHTQHLINGIWAADLYWITADFTQLAIMAGQDFTRLVLSPEELPSPRGFMIFETPIFEIPVNHGVARVRAITWVQVPDGIWLNLYIQGEDGDPTVDVVEMREKLGWLICPNAGGGIHYDTEIDLQVADVPEEEDFIRTIFATWFLMAQPGVTESRTAPVDKKLARSYQRAKKPMPNVRLVDLRHRPQRTTGSPVETRTGRKLTMRQFRRGHWKRQAYGPKRGQRKTIYVSPYIAGPDGAPLKAGPTVVKVVR